MSTTLATPVERCIAELVQRKPLAINDIETLTLRDLPDGENKKALLRHRFTAGLSLCPNSRVLVP
jgi:hypothetical protein